MTLNIRLSDEQKEELLNFPTHHEIYEQQPAETGSYNEKSQQRDFWIISHWPHCEYRDIGFAKKNLEKLRTDFPGKEFRMYHCKRNMRPSTSGHAIKKLADVIDMLLAPQGEGPIFKERIEIARAAVRRARPRE